MGGGSKGQENLLHEECSLSNWRKHKRNPKWMIPLLSLVRLVVVGTGQGWLGGHPPGTDPWKAAVGARRIAWSNCGWMGRLSRSGSCRELACFVFPTFITIFLILNFYLRTRCSMRDTTYRVRHQSLESRGEEVEEACPTKHFCLLPIYLY